MRHTPAIALTAALACSAGTASAELIEVRATGTLESALYLWNGVAGPLHGETWELVYTIDTSLLGTTRLAAVSASLRIGNETHHADMASQGPGMYMSGMNHPSHTYNRDSLNLLLDFGDDLIASLRLSAPDTWWHHPATGFHEWEEWQADNPDPYYGDMPTSFDLSDFVYVSGQMSFGGFGFVCLIDGPTNGCFEHFYPDSQISYNFNIETVTGRLVPSPGVPALLLTAGLAAARRRR